jgi:hypothetical protein
MTPDGLSGCAACSRGQQKAGTAAAASFSVGCVEEEEEEEEKSVKREQRSREQGRSRRSFEQAAGSMWGLLKIKSTSQPTIKLANII